MYGFPSCLSTESVGNRARHRQHLDIVTDDVVFSSLIASLDQHLPGVVAMIALRCKNSLVLTLLICNLYVSNDVVWNGTALP